MLATKTIILAVVRSPFRSSRQSAGAGAPVLNSAAVDGSSAVGIWPAFCGHRAQRCTREGRKSLIICIVVDLILVIQLQLISFVLIDHSSFLFPPWCHLARHHRSSAHCWRRPSVYPAQWRRILRAWRSRQDLQCALDPPHQRQRRVHLRARPAAH